MSFDDLITKKINQVKLLVWDNEEGSPLIEAISFQFEGNKSIILKVDPDTDEILLEIDYQNQFHGYDEFHKIVVVEEQDDSSLLSQCLNTRLGYFWILTNNQKYQDGVEMEFVSSTDSICLRFLVVASSIKIGLILDML